MVYNPLINYLINQAKNPSGFVGQLITTIWSSYFDALSRWSSSLVRIAENTTILDIGYGGGSNICILYNAFPSVSIYGIDISQESYKTAIKNNKEGIVNGRVTLLVQDVSHMKFNEGMFDTIFAIQSHIYWSNLEEGLSECYRTLIDGDRLVITSEIDKINYHLSKYRNHNLFRDYLLTLKFSTVEITIKENYVAFICTK